MTPAVDYVVWAQDARGVWFRWEAYDDAWMAEAEAHKLRNTRRGLSHVTVTLDAFRPPVPCANSAS